MSYAIDCKLLIRAVVITIIAAVVFLAIAANLYSSGYQKTAVFVASLMIIAQIIFWSFFVPKDKGEMVFAGGLSLFVIWVVLFTITLLEHYL